MVVEGIHHMSFCFLEPFLFGHVLDDLPGLFYYVLFLVRIHLFFILGRVVSLYVAVGVVKHI